MISLFNNAAFDVLIKSDQERNEHNLFTDLISVDCVHTLASYYVEVGFDDFNCTDKSSKTYFRMGAKDDATDEDKEIELLLIGGAEREILIGLLEAAVGLLKNDNLNIQLRSDTNV